MRAQVAVIVVNYGSGNLLERNLVQVADGSPGLQIYVVDNYSSVDERDRASALCQDRGWHFLAQSRNLGFGGGVNAGARSALQHGATDLLLLNPDATISPYDLARMQAAADADRRLVAAPVIKTTEGKMWFNGVTLDLDSGDLRRSRGEPTATEVEWVTGACMWITAEAWAAVGPFDDEYFLYWEDVDYSYRARQAGMTVAVVHDACAVHDEGGTQQELVRSDRAKSNTYYYYNIRNRMLFASRHLGDTRLRAWRGGDVSAAYQVLLRGGRRQFLASPRPLYAGLRAVRDGRRIYREAMRARRQELFTAQP